LAALLAVTFWGATPIATKRAVTGLDPLAVGLLRTLLAGILAAPLLLATTLILGGVMLAQGDSRHK